jgi:hypothetical protein
MNEMTIAELDDEICSLAARISAATARLLMLVGEFDAREGWAGYGVKSCAHWLSWKCQIGTHAAREQVRVARALRDLPVIRGEFCAGQLSYAKVRALTRIAAPDIEPDLVELARSTTAAQLERTAAGWRRVETLDDEARSQRAAWMLKRRPFCSRPWKPSPASSTNSPSRRQPRTPRNRMRPPGDVLYRPSKPNRRRELTR